MRYRTTDFGYLVTLERGEELIRALIEFARHEDVAAAALTGLGSLARLALGFYDPAAQEYVRREWSAALEVASLVGTVSLLDGEVFPHVHGVFSDRAFNVVGGHVFEAVVSVGLEVPVYTSEGAFERSPVDYCNLKLIDLSR
ncbi:MAG: DNA-binding protein [Gemmatimonadetes bacterium]|nr:DNA-binding protein [Gemmatimonadota bacterium]